MVVVRPIDPKQFNGTVVAEWLNVTNGGDAATDWIAVHCEVMRTGSAYVGVSAQKQGVDGAPFLGSAARPLKVADPARYASLRHPGDAYAYDIFSQAGQAIRSAAGDGLLGGRKRVGSSRSAYRSPPPIWSATSTRSSRWQRPMTDS